MYKQSIQDIQLVIIPLDGTIFNLNRYRYNYTHHFCESHHLDYSLPSLEVITIFFRTSF